MNGLSHISDVELIAEFNRLRYASEDAEVSRYDAVVDELMERGLLNT